MPRFIIERDLAGVGQMSAAELAAIARQSCDVLQALGPQIQWVQSFVTDDRIYCEYIAPDEAMVREHATRGGFPATKVSEVRARIDPTSADARMDADADVEPRASAAGVGRD